MPTPKRVKIKQSDLAKLPASIRNDPDKMAIVNTILSTYTKLEAKYGYDLFLEVVEAVPVPTPTQPTGAILASCKWVKFPMVNVKYSGTDGWDGKIVDGKKCIGILELNGRKVEWFKPGQTAISVKNAINDPKYYQNIPKGSVVTINIADVNGKRDSNRMTLVWP